jgi:hypothetical protein
MRSLGRSNLHERLLAARKVAGYQTATDAARSIGTSYPTYALVTRTVAQALDIRPPPSMHESSASRSNGS